MTATDELRRMLDEADVEWDYGITGAASTKFNANGVELTFIDMRDGVTCSTILSPAQAIAATVGRGTCRMETADGCQNWNSCSECGADYYTDQPINYCPNCGRRVMCE